MLNFLKGYTNYALLFAMKMRVPKQDNAYLIVAGEMTPFTSPTP